MSAASRRDLLARVTMPDDGGGVAMGEDMGRYPWVGGTDERFTLALVLDVGEVLARHGYDAPTGTTLVELTAGLYRALHLTTIHQTPPY